VANITKILQALGDETRVRILNLLQAGPLCGCEIEEVLEIGQSNTSRHLGRLKNAEVIVTEKRAQWVYHRLDEVAFITYPFLRQLMSDISHLPNYQADLDRFRRYREMGGGCGTPVKL